jgi:hypothetical protein
MSLLHQALDILVGGAIALLSTSLLGAALGPSTAVAVGAFLASAFYFSRNPWGSPDGARFNARVDDAYDRLLP